MNTVTKPRWTCAFICLLCVIAVHTQQFSFTIQSSDPSLIQRLQSVFQGGQGTQQGSSPITSFFQNVQPSSRGGGQIQQGSSPITSFFQNVQPSSRGGGGRRRQRQQITIRQPSRTTTRTTQPNGLNNFLSQFLQSSIFNQQSGQGQRQISRIGTDNPAERRHMFWIQPQPSGPSKPTSITPSQPGQFTGSYGIPSHYQKVILDYHNEKRAELKAADMYALKWNNKLAQESYDWARQCQWGHQEAGRGENLAYVTGGGLKMLLDYGLNGWYDEINQYDGKDCMATGSCHYTQMVWASTTEVGCAVHQCPDMHYLVCFYASPGNIIGQPPYEVGTPCSHCTGQCRNNLCYW